MFIPDSLCQCAHETKVGLNGRTARRVPLGEVQFTAEGMALIGLGMTAMAEKYGLPVGLLGEAMKNNLYAAPPSRSLYFLFHVSELDADMHIEIAPRHFRLVVPD